MKRVLPRSVGLRGRLALMIAIVSVPFALALLLVLMRGGAFSEERARFNASARAALVAGSIERQVSDIGDILTRVAERPLVRLVDRARCDPILVAFPILHPSAVNLGVVDLEGNVVCDAVRGVRGEQASVDSPAWRREVLGSAGLVVGTPFVGPITGVWVTVVWQPTRREGRVVGYLGLPVSLEQFSASFRDVTLPPGSVITVVDRGGRVIARTEDAGEFVGSRLPPGSAFRAPLQAVAGSFEARGLDGEDRFFGYASVEAAEWVVYSSTPVDIALASARRNEREALGLVLLALLGGVLLAAMVARSVRRPLTDLVRGTEDVARGARHVKVAGGGPPEIVDLAVSFNAMVEELDAADERTARAALEGERRFQTLANASEVMMWVAGWDSSKDFYSRGWLDMRGRTREEEAGVGWRAGLHPDDLERVTRDTELLWAEPREYVLQYRIQNAAGDFRSIVEHGIPYRAPDGAFHGYVGTDVDITNELRSERERLEAQTLLDTAMEAAPVGVGFVDSDLRYVRVNRALAEFHEVSVEEHLGRTIHDVVGARGVDLEEHYRRVLETGHPLIGIETGIDVPGARRYLAHYHPVRVSDEIVGVGIVTVDITERRNLEAQFLQAQKLEAVGRLAGGVAHDFNNLLGVMAGYAELIAARLPEGDEIRNHALEISRASLRGADLTRRLLAFSRDQVLAEEDVDLREVLGDLGRLLERLVPERVELDVDGGHEPAVVHVDVSRLGQVLVNLVVNAVDAMPSGGELHVRLRCESDVVRLTVEDTGEGIEPGDIARLFEPFFTTKEHGSGLGLSTVHGIVEQAGGATEVTSARGSGSRFTVVLPRVHGAAAKLTGAREGVPDVKASALGETVLVVEDSELLRNLVQSVLERSGYRVRLAENGEQAIQRVAQEGPPDLVIADVEMPRMGGLVLANRLAADHPHVPVLLMSGYAADDHIDDLAEYDYLAKPFTPADLATRVRALLDR